MEVIAFYQVELPAAVHTYGHKPVEGAHSPGSGRFSPVSEASR